MPDGPPRITLSRPTLDAAGLATLGARWRELEGAAVTSPFQSWSWIGIAASGFDAPVLVEANDATGMVGLALFNQRPSMLGPALHLHQTGDPAQDAVFTEHNDPLVARRALDPVGLMTRMLHAALGAGPGLRLVLAGVGAATHEAAVRTRASLIPGPVRIAPFVDLSRIPQGTEYIDRLSRNARAQLRRSDRAYAALGPLHMDRAMTVAQRAEFFAALVGLHSATWQARGKPGAFATPAVRNFHEALIREDDAALLRISAGATVIGYLYNLVRDGNACAYQSGFDYAGAPPYGKPGLTCHHQAITAHRAAGGATYDFLGGADRYKRSLATDERPLYWFSVAPRWHPAAVAAWLRHRLDR